MQQQFIVEEYRKEYIPFFGKYNNSSNLLHPGNSSGSSPGRHIRENACDICTVAHIDCRCRRDPSDN